jgi:hypothetical protein
VDLSGAIRPGRNRVDLVRHGDGSWTAADLVTSCFAPWEETPRASAPGGPRLKVSCDRSEVRVGDDVTCRVSVTPRPDRQWAMLLAEVGLPPGAEVDRAALERALEQGGPLQRYEVLPDRVVAYLWSWKREAVEFDLRFRPRLAVRGKTAPSSVADYYDPDASAVLAPRPFRAW